jgi:hypothetical protein
VDGTRIEVALEHAPDVIGEVGRRFGSVEGAFLHSGPCAAHSFECRSDSSGNQFVSRPMRQLTRQAQDPQFVPGLLPARSLPLRVPDPM